MGVHRKQLMVQNSEQVENKSCRLLNKMHFAPLKEVIVHAMGKGNAEGAGRGCLSGH